MKHATLVTISFSHFCEKGRWALDRGGVAYAERGHAPVLHLLGTLPRGGRSTPLLLLPDGRKLKQSTDILLYVEGLRPGLLYPSDPAQKAEVEALVARFDDELGPATRRLVYHAIFSAKDPLAPMIAATSTGLTRAIAPVVAPLLPPLIGRSLRIDDAGAARSNATLESLLADVESRLADGRRYLVGDRFTAADLTFAALYSPFLMPPEQPRTGSAPVPPSLVALRDASRARPAGRFAMRLYAQERRAAPHRGA